MKQIVQCYFNSGPHKKKSKGLLQLAKELNVVLPLKCSLPQLRELLSKHPAFQVVNNKFIFKNMNLPLPV
jgi:hypothetical protein